MLTKYLLSLTVVIMLVVPAVAQENEQNTYRTLMSRPGVSKLTQMVGSMMLSLPGDTQRARPSLERIWWANNVKTKLTDEQRSEAFEVFSEQYDKLIAATKKFPVQELEVVGFAKIGSVRNLDVYYAGNADQGPVMYRVSFSFRDRANPWLYGIKVFDDYDAIREESRAIAFDSGLAPMVVKKKPKEQQPE